MKAGRLEPNVNRRGALLAAFLDEFTRLCNLSVHFFEAKNE